jgi:hypothetical protein
MPETCYDCYDCNKREAVQIILDIFPDQKKLIQKADYIVNWVPPYIGVNGIGNPEIILKAFIELYNGETYINVFNKYNSYSDNYNRLSDRTRLLKDFPLHYPHLVFDSITNV